MNELQSLRDWEDHLAELRSIAAVADEHLVALRVIASGAAERARKHRSLRAAAEADGLQPHRPPPGRPMAFYDPLIFYGRHALGSRVDLRNDAERDALTRWVRGRLEPAFTQPPPRGATT